jgi:hypothetical protein
MIPLSFPTPTRLLTAFIATCLIGSAADAQNPAPSPSPAAAAPQPAQPNPDNDWLAKTSKLYYSSAKAGLTGFDCTVHPDWHTLFASADKGSAVPDDDPRIALLNAVKISVHARMKGGSTIEWVVDSNPDKSLDQNSTDLLDSMHKSVEQTLEGFLQFWGPFMEGTVVPDSAEGLEITHTPTVHTIHAKQAGTELTEVFSSDLVLEQFNVNMSAAAIKFLPAYKPTAQGLLVSAFKANILPEGMPAEQAQVMKVNIEYQPVGTLIVPGKLNMEVIGTGTFNFTFDGCTTNPK